MSQVVVFGATGYAGSRIVAEAARRGHRVTAVSRHGHAAADTVSTESVRNATGSLYDHEAVLDLTHDADVVVSAITSGPDSQGRTLPDAVPILVDVSRRFGARIGVVGGAGSLLIEEGGERVITQLEALAPPEKLRDIRLHMDFLDLLCGTADDIDWFYVSPPKVFGAHVGGERRGHYRVGHDILLTDEQGNSAISGDDFAIAFVDEIDHPRHHRCRFTVAY